MNTLKTIATATLVLAAGLGLTACTASPTPQPTVTGAATTTATPTDGPTDGPQIEEPPVEPVGYEAGEVLTAAPTDLPVSQRAFAMADGTFIIVDRYQPLPAPVQEAVTAQVDAAVIYTGSMTEGGWNLAYQQATGVRSSVGLATNKNIVVVYRVQGIAEGCNGTGVNPWNFTGNTSECAAFGTSGEAAAAAQAAIDARGDTAISQVIIDQG